MRFVPDAHTDDSKAFLEYPRMTPKPDQPVPNTICDNALELESCALSETID
jgi:hypothetical protein